MIETKGKKIAFSSLLSRGNRICGDASRVPLRIEVSIGSLELDKHPFSNAEICIT